MLRNLTMPERWILGIFFVFCGMELGASILLILAVWVKLMNLATLSEIFRVMYFISLPVPLVLLFLIILEELKLEKINKVNLQKGRV